MLRRLILLFAVGGSACVRGDVYDPSQGEPRRFADSDVLLVKDTPDLRSALKHFCDAERRMEEERRRIRDTVSTMRDSAGAVYQAERESPRWRLYSARTKAAEARADSVELTRRAEPDTIAGRLASRRTRTDVNGRYAFSGLWPGRYFVVPVVRSSEYSALDWYPLRVRPWASHLDLTGRDGRRGCFVLED
jgi:hypothetical protein